MESLYDITLRLGKGQGEEMMWDTLRVVSDAIEGGLSEKDRMALNSKIYGLLSGGHFDEDYAMDAVSRMYYTDKDGAKRYAPYWTIPQVEEIYDSVRGDVPNAYNEWDFFVTMNMIASDTWGLLHEWWPSLTPEQFTDRVTDLAANWLDDEDNPFGTKKIWCYLNSAK